MDTNLTQKQLEANKENAKLGGVKTEAGKAVSRLNAVKHGLRAVLISDYEKELFKSLVLPMDEISLGQA